MERSNKQISWAIVETRKVSQATLNDVLAYIQDSRIDRGKLNCKKFSFIVVELSYYLKL